VIFQRLSLKSNPISVKTTRCPKSEMSQYKILPPYSDLTNLDITGDFHHVPVIFSAQVGGDRLDLDAGLQVSGEMDGNHVTGDQGHDQGYVFPWSDQDTSGVQAVQETLNSQPTVLTPSYQIYQPTHTWLEDTKFLIDGQDDEESLDLSSTSISTSPIGFKSSPILSFSYSPPREPRHINSRLTILPPRSNSFINNFPAHPHLQQQQQQLQQQISSQSGGLPQQSLPSTSMKHDKERRVRARPRSNQELREVIRPCRVCGEKAGKHSYYGGQVCPSCRAFFRRSVQSGYNATYYCVKEGECEITLKTRKNCQFCRYKLCEMAGMKTSWVLTEEERKLKFAGKGKKRKDRMSSSGLSDCQGTMDQVAPGQMPMLGLCEGDMNDIQTYVLASGCYEVSRVADMDTQLIRKIIRMIAFKAQLDTDGQEQLQHVIRSRSQKFVTKLSEFTSLDEADRTTLLTSNLSLMTTLTTCSLFPGNLRWNNQLAPLLGEGEVEKLDTKLRSLNVLGLDQLHLDYNQFFSLTTDGIGDSDKNQTDRFMKLVQYIGTWHQDPTELMLLSLVVFFSSDMLDLNNRPKVESIQMEFVLLLQKYVSIRHQSDTEASRARFTRAMMMIILIREMLEIQANTILDHKLQEL